MNYSENERTIRLGSKTIMLTRRECILQSVAYEVAPANAAGVERCLLTSVILNYASPEEVLLATHPSLRFGVDAEEYASMAARALRLQWLRKKHKIGEPL